MNCEVKAGVHVNRSKNWSIIKRELLGLKWVGNTTSVGQRKITGRSNIATQKMEFVLRLDLLR